MRVLVLNAGSATLKSTVIEPFETAARISTTTAWSGDVAEAVRTAIRDATDALPPGAGIDAVGHRVVHGGARYTSPTLIDDQVVQAIEELTELAPLHNPIAAATIRAARDVLPSIPHVAVFDTAFHASLPEAVTRYPIPISWLEDGAVRRYGFHGLSVAWSTRRAAELLSRPMVDLRLVVAHLGGGCSVTAVDGGRSVDTSMGMTPLEGLMMGTRAGSIDPGIILRRLREGQAAVDIERDLDRRSGLVAVAGTDDVRELLRRAAGDDATAALAIEMFVRRAAAWIAASATALPSVDAIVFTGGIGQHADAVTERIRDRLHLVGPVTSSTAQGEDRVDKSASGVSVLRIAAREDLVIADAVVELVGPA
jgi:acetate kinase